MISRRRFVGTAVLGALVGPSGTQAQQRAGVPRVGILLMASSEVASPYLRAIAEGFGGLGYVPGKTIVLDPRFAGGRPERLQQLAAELVKSDVDAIIAGGNLTIEAAKEATSLIPIVMATSSRPVAAGFVQSLARPGGNITGLTVDPSFETLIGKQLALLREMLPGRSRVGILWDPQSLMFRDHFKVAQDTARQVGLTIHSLEFSGAATLETAFAMARQERAQAMLVFGGHLVFTHHADIAALAIKHRLPAIGYHREFVEVGGLMCYGVNVAALSRRTAYYVDRILKGAKPADLPVEQPTTFELLINGRTARTLGIAIPPSLRLRADRIIE